MDLDLAAMMVANLRSGNPNQILKIGGLAQLVERLLCKQEVRCSNHFKSIVTLQKVTKGASFRNLSLMSS